MKNRHKENNQVNKAVHPVVSQFKDFVGKQINE